MRANANYEVIKEPRGFIKCLEICLAIFAFSCATGFRGKFSFHQSYTPPGNGTVITQSHTANGAFKYPFDGAISVKVFVANQTGHTYIDYPIDIDQRSSTEFYVVIGVFCFLYSLGVLAYYIWFEPENKTAPTSHLNPPVIDFVVGAFWAFFWFVSACAQAAAVGNIKDSTNVKDIISGLDYCKGPLYSCSVGKSAKYATLTVSILLGFLNVFVWAGNMWFLWKETPWHKGNRAPQAATVQQQQPQHQSVPPAAAI